LCGSSYEGKHAIWGNDRNPQIKQNLVLLLVGLEERTIAAAASGATFFYGDTVAGR